MNMDMKRFWKNITFALALPLLAIGCTTDYPEPNINELPQASDLMPRIEIDQEQNLVTFSIDNSGMVPMWIFGDEPIDGKASKKYAYTQNGVTLRIRDKGIHQVELKAYNRNGISVGSKMVEFTMDKDYHDPFDASPYMKALSNNSTQNWQWNSTADGHFGCGQTGNNPTEWYAAKAGEKPQLYDDMLTFTVDGEYTFDPGADGMVYVNKDSGYKPEYYAGNDEDYLAPIETYTTTYSIEQKWNDAGIEEIYLVLPDNTNISYIPNPTAYAEPRFRFMETTTSSIKKTLKLVMDTPTENGGGGIAWYYEFVPVGKVVTEEEMLAGSTAEGKVWIMDAAAAGHLGCGESAENPAGWWSASAYEKADAGMYDNELTFYPDGRYVFDPGADGLIYVNWGCTLVGPNTGSEPDNSVAWSTQEGNYIFANGTITLPEGFTVGYIPSDAAYTDPTFIVTELTETKLTLVSNLDGIAWQYKFTARDAQPETVTFDGQEFVNGMVETSLAQNGEIAITGIDLNDVWVDPDFFTMVNANTLKFNAVSGEYRIIWDGTWFKTLPLKNGEPATYANNGDLWIIGDGGGKPSLDGQIGWVTESALPCARIDQNTYRITLAMKAEGGSIKVYGCQGWDPEWTKSKYGVIEDNGLFNIPDDDGNIKTLNATPGFYTFTFVDNGGTLDMSVNKAKLGDTTIYDPTAAENMWLSMTYSMTYFYAPNWSEIAAPDFEDNGNDYTISLPQATSDQWQAQVAFHTTMSSSSAKTYDFYLEMTSTEDHPGVTIKLVKEGDDGTFYFADRHALTADETFVYKVSNIAGIDMESINLFFDFGGNVAGTEVNIKNIIFQEHREEE